MATATKSKRRRFVPEWLADLLACPQCGRPRVETPSGYMGCRMAGHVRLVTPGGVAELVESGWDVNRARTRMGVRGAVKLAWSYLRGTVPRVDAGECNPGGGGGTR